MHLWAESCGQLGEETRLASLTEMLNAQRRPGAMPDELLARAGAVRMRAGHVGQLGISPQGMPWMLCGLQRGPFSLRVFTAPVGVPLLASYSALSGKKGYAIAALCLHLGLSSLGVFAAPVGVPLLVSYSTLSGGAGYAMAASRLRLLSF